MKTSNNRGVTLTEVVIAGAILSILVLAGTQLLKTHFQASAALDSRLEVIGLKSLLLTSLDCTETLPTDLVTGCPSGYLDLQNGRGDVLFPANGTTGARAGKVAVRARCVPGALNIEVKQSESVIGGAQDWQPLFSQGLEMCRGNFIPRSTGGGVVAAGGNVCEDVGEFRYEACIGKGKKEKRCEKKESRIFRRCMRWAGGSGNSPKY